jgi:pimeloyl-ACP methyl ester carboxylesterase
VQMLTSAMIADPAQARMVPAMYAMMDANQYQQVAPRIYAACCRQPIGFGGMSEAMDLASGVSPQRLQLVREQAKTAILGDVLNFPVPHLLGAFGVPDLGETFRRNVKTEVPALFLTGTLDGRTYPEEHAEIIKGFSKATQVVVENAGHNLLVISPEVIEAIIQFMKGQPVNRTLMAVEPPTFPH